MKITNKAENIRARQAHVGDIELLVPLFDAYRVFYGQSSDLDLARSFLLERFQHNQSVLFIALQSNDKAVGFTQLYPTFSSVSATRALILNDLYVVPEARRSGVAVKLLDAAANYGRAVGAIRLSLSTAVDKKRHRRCMVLRVGFVTPGSIPIVCRFSCNTVFNPKIDLPDAFFAGISGSCLTPRNSNA